MSTSIASHTKVISKRSLSVATYAIIASSVGAVFIFFAALTLWMVIRGILRRRKRVRLRISGPLTVNHEEARQALRLLSHARQPSVISAATEPLTPYSQLRSPFEDDILKVPEWRSSNTSTLAESSKDVSRPTSRDLQKPIPVVTQPLSRNGTRRRSLDAETASIYSSMSAPLDYHEKLFSTPLMALDPNVPISAPAWVTNISDQQPGILSPVFNQTVRDSRRSPSSHVQAGSTRQKGSTRRSDRRHPTVTISPNTTYTSIPAWSHRTEHHPPARIHWKVSTAGPHEALPEAVSQPVADMPSLPSPPLALPSISPLNIRSKATRDGLRL